MNPNRRPTDRRCCGRHHCRRYRLPAAQPSRIVSHCRRRRCLLVVRCSTGRRVHVIIDEILNYSQVQFETHIDTRRMRDVHLNPHLCSLALSCFPRRQWTDFPAPLPRSYRVCLFTVRSQWRRRWQWEEICNYFFSSAPPNARWLSMFLSTHPATHATSL